MKKRILSLVLALVLVMSAAVVPAFAVTTENLTKQRETEHFEFYCTDQDVKALDDLVKSFEGCYDRVTADLGKAPSGKTKVNIYPDIQSFHSTMGDPNGADWFVGQAKNDEVYMTSPLNPGPAHTYDELIQIAVHEFTHIVINLFGNVPIYMHEGVACYEAGQYSGKYQELSAFITNQMQNNKVPSLSTLESADSSTEGLYEYSYAFVDFIARRYGFDKVIELLEGKPEALSNIRSSAFNQQWWQTLAELYVKNDSLTESMETENFVLVFSSRDSEAASELAFELEKCRKKAVADLKISSSMKQIIRIYPDNESYRKGLGFDSGDTFHVIFNSAIYCISPANLGSQSNRKDQIGKIVVQSEQILLYAVSRSLPYYLSNGISYHEAGATISGLKDWVKRQTDAGTLPTLMELEKNTANNYNVYGYIYVEFVAQIFGYENLYNNLASLLEGKSQEKVFGMTAQQLNEKWMAFLKDYDKMALPSNLDTADTWAKPEIISAVRKGFVPFDLQNNYRNAITREQFCQMAIMYLEYATGKDIQTILSERNLTIRQDAFVDTDNSYILAAYALGITKGTSGPSGEGPGVFDPDASISREMAATMLTRLSKAMGNDTDNAADAGYTDIGRASSWAVNSINYCYASGVMKGANLTFSPKDTYTIQQSIATLDRMD